MAPKFGTSGLRGLVTELTDDLVSDHIHAFIAACPTGGAVHIGEDLRPSSPNIADAVEAAVTAAGLTAIRHGALPTPALALASMTAGQAAVMITGSHIPADRNGLKFYVPKGEISKEDEAAITAALGQPAPTKDGATDHQTTALPVYVDRYVSAFGTGALSGLKIGVYQHSSVARDVMVEVLTALGAAPVALAHSDVFIPVDTEAVDPETQTMLADWAHAHGLDAILSTDGDGDRPMVAGPDGAIIPGDILGPLTAQFLGADQLITPVSSNSLIDDMDCFASCQRTRIGSPFVIAGMETALSHDPNAKVAGYEANGGFLLGYTATGPAGPLPPLMTRDSLLPMLAPLVAAQAQGLTLSALAATLPACFTAAGRVQNIPTDKSSALIEDLTADSTARAAFFEGVGEEKAVDLTDGLRVSFAGGAVVHLRPSGNAPECRCYVEHSDPKVAKSLVEAHLAKLADQLAGQ
ncbi:phosphomannomutase [Pseudooctadecabacter jejudonensis]|uniref:Phosphoglucosamine mutase n=1 Tax=Pseudooctadecabacter jejudonensis TaxID=1391910 RepID=A0A1Y5TJL5_9RHOB|nr:phosphomannomutase [Pseudooctadecabacter jejudonensis]SLN61931.1 Phosphoglucosamine mutase [Pseudooctadecabacter jejudonensis]